MMSDENEDEGESRDEPATDPGAGGQQPGDTERPQGNQSGNGQPPGGDGQPRGGQPGGGEPPQGGQPQQGQPPQGQPRQGQPGGRPQGQGPPPGGQQPVRRGPSFGQKVQAAFGDYGVQNQIKAVTGLWALIGLGLGLTPVLLGLLGPGGAILGGVGAGIALASGPIIGGLLGLSLSNKMPGEPGPIAVVSAAVNYAGFVVMVVLFGVLLMIQSGGAGGGTGLGNLIGPLLLTGIPVAITAGGATALGRYVDYPATREEAEAQEPPAPAPRGPAPRQPQGPQ